jgi:hypothetical protein
LREIHIILTVLSDYFDLHFLNSGIAIECPNKLGSFNQFEKGAVGFQIKQI